MDLYGRSVGAASTRISMGWPCAANAAIHRRTMDFMLIPRIQYQSNSQIVPGGTRLKLEGVYSVLPTPFTAAGELDLESLKRVVDLFIGAGVNGLTALGVTSEVARMNDTERVRVLETVVRHVNGRVRVGAGATADGVRTISDYSKFARDTGAESVM